MVNHPVLSAEQTRNSEGVATYLLVPQLRASLRMEQIPPETPGVPSHAQKFLQFQLPRLIQIVPWQLHSHRNIGWSFIGNHGSNIQNLRVIPTPTFQNLRTWILCFGTHWDSPNDSPRRLLAIQKSHLLSLPKNPGRHVENRWPITPENLEKWWHTGLNGPWIWFPRNPSCSVPGLRSILEDVFLKNYNVITK